MSKELINFKLLLDMYGKELQALDVFKQTTTHGKKCWAELNTRVIEHVSFELLYYLLTLLTNNNSFLFFRIFAFCPIIILAFTSAV